jgi:hypothetical protein
VNRAWRTYQVGRDSKITTTLHVEPIAFISSGSDIESALVDAIVDYMRKHTDIDWAEIEPRNR